MKVGDAVIKLHGYGFPGTVVAVFRKLDGEQRVVVESALSPGLLHIFSPTQLAVSESEPCTTDAARLPEG